MTPTEIQGAPDWSALWAQYHADIVGYAQHLLCGDVHAAEDVAQETALRLWQHPEILSDNRCLRGWLHTVARNIIVDRARRRRARPTEVAAGDETIYTVDTADKGVDATAIDRVEGANSITSLLKHLSPGHRTVVFEVYARDRAVADVAADLGIPVGTVKSRCHYAIQRLRILSTAGPPANSDTPKHCSQLRPCITNRSTPLPTPRKSLSPSEITVDPHTQSGRTVTKDPHCRLTVIPTATKHGVPLRDVS